MSWSVHPQAKALNELGFNNLADVLEAKPNAIDWRSLRGIGKVSTERIKAVLEAQRTGRASPVDRKCVPERVPIEIFVDYEYLSNVNCDFSKPWPACLAGKQMIFMVGAGWEDDGGRWHYKQFVASGETKDAERDMFTEFLNFLQERGALNGDEKARLYHWSYAEVRQSLIAAVEHNLPELTTLPWFDLQKSVHAVPLGLPGAYSYGLKPVAKAISAISPDHRIEWPEGLADGLSAMVMGWKIYSESEPLQTYEYRVLSRYLEIDCKSMWQVLRWMRDFAVEIVKTPKLRVRRKRRNAFASIGWYDFALSNFAVVTPT